MRPSAPGPWVETKTGRADPDQKTQVSNQVGEHDPQESEEPRPRGVALWLTGGGRNLLRGRPPPRIQLSTLAPAPGSFDASPNVLRLHRSSLT